MASRDYTRHTVNSTTPAGAARLGDEYWNPLTNTLYKLVAVNGNSPQFNQVLVASANGVVIANSLSATASLAVAGNATVTGNIYSGTRIGFTNPSSTTSATYQVYNPATGSIDTYFG